MDNATRQLFNNSQAAFNNATANTGGGGVWPDDGQHQVFVDRVEIQPGTQFRMGQTSIPASTIRFIFTLVNDPDRAENLCFPGAPFDFPVDPTQITMDNQKKRYDISMDRFKGHCSVILGTQDPPGLVESLDAIEELLGQEQAVVVTIDVQSREHKGRTYRSEYLKECIAGPHMTPAPATTPVAETTEATPAT